QVRSEVQPLHQEQATCLKQALPMQTLGQPLVQYQVWLLHFQVTYLVLQGTPHDAERLLLAIHRQIGPLREAFQPLRVLESQISYLEEQIDVYNANLAPLKSFVLPSGTPASAHLHVARTVVRRAERCTWQAIHSFGEGVNKLTAKYLNRLSDLLFVLARYENRELGDQLWVPGKNR
ncbi:MAG: hypothetical protein RLZZ486_626, partial [Actinomycetota bacterium]